MQVFPPLLLLHPHGVDHWSGNLSFSAFFLFLFTLCFFSLDIKGCIMILVFPDMMFALMFATLLVSSHVSLHPTSLPFLLSFHLIFLWIFSFYLTGSNGCSCSSCISSRVQTDIMFEGKRRGRQLPMLAAEQSQHHFRVLKSYWADQSIWVWKEISCPSSSWWATTEGFLLRWRRRWLHEQCFKCQYHVRRDANRSWHQKIYQKSSQTQWDQDCSCCLFCRIPQDQQSWLSWRWGWRWRRRWWRDGVSSSWGCGWQWFGVCFDSLSCLKLLRTWLVFSINSNEWPTTGRCFCSNPSKQK